MDERLDTEMDRVLRANRALHHSKIELVEADGTHIAYVAPIRQGDEPGLLIHWKGGTYVKVDGLKLIYRETPATPVTEV